MNDPWTRGPISELREKAARDGRAGAQGGRVISRSLLPPSFSWPESEKIEKSKGDGEKNEEEKETEGRKSRKTSS